MLTLIQKFETDHYPVPAGKTGSMLRHLIEARDFQEKSLLPFLGNEKTVALVLNDNQAAEQIDEELPEHVFRSEILLDGRSSVDGNRLTAMEYAELQSDLEMANAVETKVPSKLGTLVGFVKLRKFIETSAADRAD